MFKKFIILLFIFSGVLNFVYADSKYTYVCDNEQCFNTQRDFIGDNYYLYDITYQNTANFADFISSVLDDYVDYYGSTTFTIENFCIDECDDLYDNELDLEGILSYTGTFYIGKETFLGFGDNEIIETYDSGKDYLFSNFTKVIDQLHMYFPIGDKKSELSDILKNINYYDGNFGVRNVCENYSCVESKFKFLSFNDIKSYKFIDGEIKQSNYFTQDTFKVSSDYNISKLSLQAGESLDFNFGFEDYLEFFTDSTEYEYTIYYNFDGEGEPSYDEYFIKETILIDNDDFSVSSPNISDDVIGDIIDIEVLDEEDKKIRVGITETINLSKSGKINFYLSVKNLSSGEEFSIQKVNAIPVSVLPNDDVSSGEALITSTFSKDLNSEGSGFNVNSPFPVKISLFDEYLNEHFDNIEGYEISLSSGSSEYIELSVDDENYSKVISGIKTDDNNSVNFYFRITEPGYHDLNGFDIKVRLKSDINNYSIPAEYFTVNDIVPSNLYDGDQKMKIFIQAPLVSELPVSCGQTVTINFNCTSDNFSGCDASGDTSVSYNSQEDNGESGSVTIVDYAYNTRIYEYTINHVDRTGPSISLFKSSSTLLNDEYSYIVNEDNFVLKFFEWTTSSCIAEVNYLIKVNGDVLYNGTLSLNNPEYLISDFFKTSGKKNVYIKATDKYGNFTEKNIKFNLYPDYVSEINSSVNLINSKKGSKFANNDDFYEYELTLKDKYDNPIYSKEIGLLDQDCTSITGCKTILTDIGNDALKEITSDLDTDLNGKVRFKLKSLAPGDFHEVFNIKLNKWNTKYEDSTYDIGNYYIGNMGTNKFKKPVIGNLSIEGGDKPVIGKKQKYNIKLINTGSLNGYTNGQTDISKNTIINKIDGHVWNNFELLNKNFSSNLDTVLGFTGMIDANNNILLGPSISSNNLKISYELGGDSVSYYLDDFGFTGCSNETLGLKVIGVLQGDGKSNITGQESNFSDLSKSELRQEIRKNAYIYTRNMKDGLVSNNVMYVVGDITISGNNLGYETLVVKDGNVIIDGDLNDEGKKLGIIVLKDGYNVSSDYNKSGNVYVNKSVENINAIIYADGTLRSAKEDGSSYSDSELNSQLHLRGSLFTRNTIGGAVLGGSKYVLPGGQETTIFDLAQYYDLNYVRKVESSCLEEDSEYSFLIEYNPNIQANPPKLFRQ